VPGGIDAPLPLFTGCDGDAHEPAAERSERPPMPGQAAQANGTPATNQQHP
jgi:hypothetical protein